MKMAWKPCDLMKNTELTALSDQSIPWWSICPHSEDTWLSQVRGYRIYLAVLNLYLFVLIVLYVKLIYLNQLIVTTLTILLISTIVIICIACTGPRRTTSIKVMKNDKYIEAVTSCGLVQGILEDNAYVFRGIPYAMPPVGNRRWQPAESLSRIEHCWNGTYLAHNSSKSCWQRDIHGHIDGDEDCLYLDVFTPTVGYNFPLSVVVMIGAETLNGGSPGVMQPSAKLAHIRDVVFVRPNFR